MNHLSTRALVQKILTAMHSVIEKFELELMLNFPDDLLVHDRNILKRLAVPGAKIARIRPAASLVRLDNRL